MTVPVASPVQGIQGTMSLDQMITFIRNQSDILTDQHITDTELAGYINQSCFDLWDLLTQKYGDDYVVSPYIDVIQTNGQSEYYPLPSNFYKLAGVDLGMTAQPWGRVTLYPFNFAERNDYLVMVAPVTPTVGLGASVRYRLHGNRLWFQPIIAANQILRVHYFPRFMELSDQQSIVLNNVQGGDWVTINGVCFIAAQPQSNTLGYPQLSNYQFALANSMLYSGLSSILGQVCVWPVGSSDAVSANNLATAINQVFGQTVQGPAVPNMAGYYYETANTANTLSATSSNNVVLVSFPTTPLLLSCAAGGAFGDFTLSAPPSALAQGPATTQIAVYGSSTGQTFTINGITFIGANLGSNAYHYSGGTVCNFNTAPTSPTSRGLNLCAAINFMLNTTTAAGAALVPALVVASVAAFNDPNAQNYNGLPFGWSVVTISYMPGTVNISTSTPTTVTLTPGVTPSTLPSTPGSPQDYISAQNYFDGIDGWTDYVLWDCVVKVKVKREEDSSVPMLERKRILDRIHRMASNRDAGMPKKVSRTRNQGWSFPGGNGPGFGYGF